LFILQAPHIGLSSSGEFGRYSRDGKDNDDAACGAACGAFSHCLAQSKLKKNNTSNNKDNIEDRKEDDPNDDANVYDYQMQYIINEINKVCLKIDLENKSENDKQVCLVNETHRIGKNMLDHCIAPHFDGGGHMVVLTGIQINMPRPFDDYFCPLTFELIKKDGTVIDLMSGFKKSSSNQNRNKLQKVPSMNILSASSGDDEKSTNNSESEKDRKEKRNSFFNIFS
jgi:hypothetical protein